MSSGNYWQRTARTRLSRRRVVTGGAMLASSAVALSLLGCSDDDDGGSTGATTSTSSTSSSTSSSAAATGASGSTGASGATGASGSTGGATSSSLISTPTDSTAQAKAGGALRHFALGDPSHFDPLLSANADVVNFVAPFAYQRLLKWVLGKYPDVAEGEAEGQAATSFEVAPDRLSITFKLRPNMTWDEEAPTSGRAMNADDVLFSWKKFGELNQLAGNLVYNAESAPNAPVESIEAPDSETIVFNLRQPDSRMIPYLAAYDYFNIMPTESESAFDPRQVVRGNGPWRMKQFEPSVRLEWERNPNYYVENRPFPDTLEMPIIPDYAQRLAQFKTGSIYTTVVEPEDVVQMKKDAPGVQVMVGDQFLTGGNGYVTYGLADGTPWHDIRLRQALSMAIDRESYADAIDNRDAFEKEGLDLPIAFNSIVYAGWPGAFLDPQSSEFGDAAKYLQYNPEEAKKLVTAAGYPDGIEFDWVYSTERYGALYLKQVDVLAGMFPESGLIAKHLAITYNEYQEKYAEDTYWNFDGVVHRAGRGWPSLPSMFAAFMLPNGTHYHGALPEGGGSAAGGDPALTDMIAKIIQEFDQNASGADDDHGPQHRIALHADDGFQSAADHLLDEKRIA